MLVSPQIPSEGDIAAKLMSSLGDVAKKYLGLEKPRPLNWELTAVTGPSLTVGTPIVKLQAGGAYLRIYLTDRASGDRVSFHGPAIAASFGPGLLPVTVGGSTLDMPSEPIGTMYGGLRAKYPFDPKDLAGLVIVGSYGAGLGPTGSLYWVLFTEGSSMPGGAAVIPIMTAEMLIRSKAAGLGMGLGIQAKASAGAEGFLAMMSYEGRVSGYDIMMKEIEKMRRDSARNPMNY